MKRLLTIVVLLTSLGAVAVPAALADVGRTTTYQVTNLALVRYPHGIHLKGGANGGYCDPYAHTLPTKIVCAHPSNHGTCFATINMNAAGNAHGEVACGYTTGPKKDSYYWRVYYSFDSASSTYAWRKEELAGKPS